MKKLSNAEAKLEKNVAYKNKRVRGHIFPDSEDSFPKLHCIKKVYIQSYFSPCFPAFGLNTERYGVKTPRKTSMMDFKVISDGYILN